MEISVVIPALNEQGQIERAVCSSWRLDPLEVVVVDGGSHDQTAARARQAGARVVPARRGRGPQLNEGARRARGELLLFLHADCWLEPDAARQIQRAFTPGDLAWAAFRQRIDGHGPGYRLLEAGNAWRARRLGLAYGDQGLVVHRDLLRQVGGFPDLPLMEDVGLMRRLRGSGRRALLDGPIHVSPRRWQQNGIVRQTVRNWTLLALYRLGVPLEGLVRRYAAAGAPDPALPPTPSSIATLPASGAPSRDREGARGAESCGPT